MQIDISAEDACGTARDLRIRAPDGTPWCVVAGTVAAALGESATAPISWWSGEHRLGPKDVVGQGALSSGAILRRQSPPPAEPRALRRVGVVAGAAAGTTFALSSRETTVGRGPDCVVRVDDPAVSRVHLRLTVVSSGVAVTDLGAVNPAHVEGLRVTHEAVLLQPGELLTLGAAALRLVDDPAGIAPPPAIGAADAESACRPLPWTGAVTSLAAGATFGILSRSPVIALLSAVPALATLAPALTDRLRRIGHRRKRRRRDAAHQSAVAARRSVDAIARRIEVPDAIALRRLVERATTLPERSRAVRIGIADQAPDAVRPTKPPGLLTPVVVDLASAPLIIDLSRTEALGVARWLVAQWVSRAWPRPQRLALVADPARRADWRWLRWLPHRLIIAEDHRAIPDCDVVLVDTERVPAGITARRNDQRTVRLIVAPSAGCHIRGPSRTVARDANGGVRIASSGEQAGDDERIDDVRTEAVTASWAESFARALRRAATHGNLASDDGCDVATVNDLDGVRTESIRDCWSRADGGARVAVGRWSGGAFELDLVRDGPHALVVGTTGSGKSRLLQSWITALALCYPPDQITFALIDYKGGATFAAHCALPHVGGVLTDLDAATTARAVASLSAELRARERRLAQVGAARLDDIPVGQVTRPSRLVVVIDEFATLIDDHPDFAADLTDIARRGRSLGIHLVLATQRPGAVNPDIRANVSLRIALRTSDAQESVDIIGVDAAARIDPRQPGRAIALCGGTRTEFTVATVARMPDREAITVTALDSWNRPIDDAGQGIPDERAALEAAAAAVSSAARSIHALPVLPPWLPQLSDRIDLDALATHVAAGRPAPFALVDDPAHQRQQPCAFDPAGETILISGSAGSGRSTALAALACAGGVNLAPETLQVYVLDCGGGVGAMLSGLPHTVTSATDDDPYLTSVLLHRLEHMLAARRRRSTRTSTRARPGPVLVIVDGWERLAALSERHDNGDNADRLLRLMAECPGSGVVIAVAGGRATLAPRVASLAERHLLLRTDRSDAAALGVPARSIPSPWPAGRAVWLGDNHTIQCARPDEKSWNRAARWARPDHRAVDDVAAAPIRLASLPDRVSLADVTATARAPTSRDDVVLGVGIDQASPVVLRELVSGADPRGFLVAGPSGSGRSTALASIAMQTAAGGRSVVVIAPRSAGVVPWAERHGIPWFDSDHVAGRPPALEGCDLVVVDDGDHVPESPLTRDLAALIAQPQERCVVVLGASPTARPANGAVAAAAITGSGVLLCPDAGQPNALGAHLGALRVARHPGRGVFVPHPSWGSGLSNSTPQPIQVALP